MLHRLFCLFLILATAAADTKCHGCLNSVCYLRSPVLEGFSPVGQIAIDRTSNTFYFHVRDTSRRDHSCALNLDEIDLQSTPNIDFSFARAVDQTSRDYYLSTQVKVHKLNPESNQYPTELFDEIVWHMQFKNQLYYTDLESYGIKIYHDGKHDAIAALSNYKIDEFIVDKNDNIFFMSNYSVYRLKNNSDVSMVTDEIYTLTTDKNGDAYFVQPYFRDIYKWDYEQDKMIKIGAFAGGSPFAVVFDKSNNIIFSDLQYNGMYYLSPKVDKVCTFDNSTGRGRKSFSVTSK